jgi:hypothetical protein
MVSGKANARRIAVALVAASAALMGFGRPALAGQDIYLNVWNRGSKPVSVWAADVRGGRWTHLTSELLAPPATRGQQAFKKWHFWIAEGSRMEFEVKCNAPRAGQGTMCVNGRVKVFKVSYYIPGTPEHEGLEPSFDIPGQATADLSGHDVEIVIDPNTSRWR